MPRTANFNWTVLRAQKELCAQIWTAFSVFPFFFGKLKILRGFLAFWSFFCGKLQFGRSRSSEGIERTDFMSGSRPIQCLLPFYKKYENLTWISCILVFFCGELQFDRSRSSEGIERTDLMSGSSPIQCLLPFYKKYENPRKISCILVFLYLA